MSTPTSYMARGDGEEPEADDPLLGFEPVPHKQLKRNSLSPARQRKFIAALAATGIVTEAAMRTGASPEAFYHLRNRPGAEQFRAAWDLAVDRAIAGVEGCALQRAIEGEERMIVSGGKTLGFERRYNENLVMFFLRQRRPERYGAELTLSLRPGHPLYEKIRREVLIEDGENEQEVLDSIDKFIDDMRERRAANAQIFAEDDAEHEEARESGDERPALPGPSIRKLD